MRDMSLSELEDAVRKDYRAAMQDPVVLRSISRHAKTINDRHRMSWGDVAYLTFACALPIGAGLGLLGLVVYLLLV